MRSTADRAALRRVAVALDTSDWDRFVSLCAVFGPRVGVLKVGLEAYTRWGPKAVAEARRRTETVFLDLKLHDIPNTVAGAVRAARDLGVGYLTVHAAGGPAMLEAAARAAGREVRILAVTLLTHLGEADLADLGLPGDPPSRAARWAGMARDAGCHGAVCSALEVAVLREKLAAPFELVTPGIRLSDPVAGDDQARVLGPRAALEAGSDLLVVGRPLTGAASPQAALERWSAALAGVDSGDGA